jgi:hypothetical protein
MKGAETPMRFMVDNPICDFGLDLVRLVRGLGLVKPFLVASPNGLSLFFGEENE